MKKRQISIFFCVLIGLFYSIKSLNAKPNRNFRAIHSAAFKGNLKEIIRILKKNKNKLNIIDSRFNTPLHWACIEKQWSVVFFLINQGAEISIRNNEGNTPVDEAKFDQECLSWRDIYGNTLLHQVCLLKNQEISAIFLNKILTIKKEQDLPKTHGQPKKPEEYLYI